MPGSNGDDWIKWCKYVLKTIEAHENELNTTATERKEMVAACDKIKADLDELRLSFEVRLAHMEEQAKVQGRIWGIISGIVTGLVALGIAIASTLLTRGTP